MFKKAFRITRDVFCLVGVVLVVKYSYDYCARPKVETAPDKTKTEQAITIAKKTTNGIIDIFSNGAIKLGQITKKAKFKNMSTQTKQDLCEQASLTEQIEQVADQINYAHNYIKKETTLEAGIKNEFLARLKEVGSQIEHLDKQIKKGPPIDGSISGPVANSALTVHERNIARKFLAIVNKTEILLEDISDEVNGTQSIKTVSNNTFEGIAHSTYLLHTLVS